jgi:hypothetical protein
MDAQTHSKKSDLICFFPEASRDSRAVCLTAFWPLRSRTMLSKVWKVQRTHKGTYTGGKICLSSDQSALACWNAEDVTILDINSGQARRTFDGGEDDGFSCFALHPKGDEVCARVVMSCL